LTKLKRSHHDWEPAAPNTPCWVSEGQGKPPKYRERLFDAKQRAFLREYAELCKRRGMFLSGECGEDDWLFEMPPNAEMVCNDEGFDISFASRREIDSDRGKAFNDRDLRLELIFPIEETL